MQKRVQLSLLGDTYSLTSDENDLLVHHAAATLEERVHLAMQRAGASGTPLRATVVTCLQLLCEQSTRARESHACADRLRAICRDIDVACALLS